MTHRRDYSEWGKGADVVVKTMVVGPVDIDENALRRNGTGAIAVRRRDFQDDDGVVTLAYAVMADFFPMGTDLRRFRTIEHAMGFVTGLVLAAEQTARRRRIKQSTIEIQVEISDQAGERVGRRR